MKIEDGEETMGRSWKIPLQHFYIILLVGSVIVMDGWWFRALVRNSGLSQLNGRVSCRSSGAEAV